MKYVLVGLVLSMGSTAQAQERSGGGDANGPLHRQVGTWQVQGDASLPGPTTHGVRTCEWMERDRVLLCRFTDTSNGFSGMTVTRYDASTKATSGYWMGSSDPHGPTRITGHFDPETGTLTERGEKPIADGKTVTLDYVWTFPSDGVMLFQVYVLGEDGERRLVVSDRITRQRGR